jgi:serine O-acetyltransferase
VVGVPGRVVEEKRALVVDLEHGKLPDPISENIRLIAEQQDKLAERVRQLEGLLNVEVTVREPKTGDGE